MKKFFRLFAAVLVVGAMCAACGDDDDTKKNGPGDKPVGPGDNYPEVTVTQATSGSVKAGVEDAILITGEGFDGDLDYVLVGYEKDGEVETQSLPTNAFTVTGKRVSCGIPIGADYLDKPVKIYLERLGYDPMPLTEEITLTLPEVAEGYIPDAAFRATLMNAAVNPDAAGKFNALGLIPPASAAVVKSIVLADMGAESIEGIELFTGVEGLVMAWGMPNVKELDFSKWTAKKLDLRCERAAAVERFIGAPYAYVMKCHSCPKLTYVDVHNSDWLQRFEISDYESQGANAPNSNVTHLDIRRNCTGDYAQPPTQVGQMSHVWNNADQGFKVGENATIMIDSHFLRDHTMGPWGDVYDAWKNRGATIEVYSRIDPHRDELLGIVPMASVDPDALSNSGKLPGGAPSNKWQVDDPYTTENEAPVPYPGV